MIFIVGEQRTTTGLGGFETISTPFGEFARGEVVEAPYQIAEWFIHNGHACVARNWRWPGEKTAPKPVPTRKL